VANVAESWEFDEEAYLQGEGFVDELIAAGERAGLRISFQDNRLYAYPALVRVLPGDRAVLIDKVRERRLRPSVLADLLRDRQKRPPRFKASDFLEALHDVYQVAIRQHGTRLMEGAPVPLLDLYELFTLLPGARREYSAQEFARDVYLGDACRPHLRRGRRPRSAPRRRRSRPLTLVAPSRAAPLRLVVEVPDHLDQECVFVWELVADRPVTTTIGIAVDAPQRQN
jgi:hypothetical protein